MAAYDSAFADFCKTLLKSKPQRFNGSDIKISVGELLSLNSIDQIFDKFIEDELDQIMRKSHKDQVDYFEKMFNVSVKSSYSKWDDYIEIFERRNLAAHGELTVNEIYLKNCNKSSSDENIVIGKKLDIDQKYFNHAIDTLIDFGVISALTASFKYFPHHKEDLFSAVIEISYNLLLERHDRVALNVLEFALREFSNGANEEQNKLMTVNLAIAYKAVGNDQKSKEILQITDWTLCGPDFHLCRHAILENVEEAIKYIEPAYTAERLTLQCIREWPAFRWIRKADAFQAEAERIFLEPIYPSRAITTTEESPAVSEGSLDLE